MNPYQGLSSEAYWKLAVADKDVTTVRNLYKKRYSIRGKRIAAAGSCFAQEITKGLRSKGYEVIDKEPSPGTQPIRGALETLYGYKLYSARHGNIYTVRQLLQLAKEALGLVEYPPEAYVWSKDGRYFDAFRPSVEPSGLPTADEVILQRRDHLGRFKAVIEEADVFIFTMGLTETWVNRKFGTVYPTAPGVIAGDFDRSIFTFHNLTFNEIYEDYVEFRRLVLSVKPDMKFMLTVSPVPLTATAEASHVLVSTVRSKSVLRAVAAQLYEDFDDIDYFPSYEMFSTPFLGQAMFEDNRRTVKRAGVDAVMTVFFDEHGALGTQAAADDQDSGDPVCEEALLDAFASDGGKA